MTKLLHLTAHFITTKSKMKIFYKVNVHLSCFTSKCYSNLVGRKSLKPGSEQGLPLVYTPRDVEVGWHSWWESNSFFEPKVSTTSKPFTILLPPPNVTGTLHLGHALTTTLQDVLARWQRMQGNSVLWVPGTDHAGIATQVVVEKKLRRDRGKTRHDIGRDQFTKEVWKWKEEKGKLITSQLRSLGASLDWSKEFFTMDQKQCMAVTEAFIQLYQAGLIYRTNSLVNWSCILQSAISDIEVDYKDVVGPTMLQIPGYDDLIEFGVLTDFAYKLCDKDDEIVVSTTRIETMLGDVAIAVHPDDKRYTHLHGSSAWHPFRKERIPIIADSFVDPEFGTGAVKLTPAHDLTDFDAGKRHSLDVIPIITEDGNLNDRCGTFFGLRRLDARAVLTEELNKMGLLRGRRDHSMQVPICSRSGDVIELLLKPQWFIKCQDMADRAVAAVRSGELVIEPADFERTWFNWLENIRDWCVSRQLWWGHRIPMYMCYMDGAREHAVWIAATSEENARESAADRLQLEEGAKRNLITEQDDDVLDTWFSSALLPFSVFGWPNQTADLQRFYPLTVMETGHDILFFWVARMVMLGQQLTNQLPFKKIVLHGIVCDAHGRKMSKSLGNVISPENIVTGISLQDLQKQAQSSFESGVMSRAEFEKMVAGQEKTFPKGIPECGTDALRFTLCSHNIKNHFINFDVSECYTNRMFCNKLWQASKYVNMALEKCPLTTDFYANTNKYYSNVDHWILSRLSNMVTEVNQGLGVCSFHVATAALKSFIYHDFCDIYIESTKAVLRLSEITKVSNTCETLLTCLDVSLRAISPFMPFISEELYQQLPRLSEGSIMMAAFPLIDEFSVWKNEQLEKEMEFILEIVTTIRRLKKTYGILKQKPTVIIVTELDESVGAYISVITSLAHCAEVSTLRESSHDLIKNSAAETVGSNCSVHLITKDLTIYDAQNNLAKKQEKILRDLEKLMTMTSADGYRLKASILVQNTHLEKITLLRAELKRLQELHAALPSTR